MISSQDLLDRKKLAKHRTAVLWTRLKENEKMDQETVEEAEKLVEDLRWLLNNREGLPVKYQKELSEENLNRIGRDVAMSYGGIFINYDVLEDRVNFNCIEDDELFFSTIEFNELKDF